MLPLLLLLLLLLLRGVSPFRLLHSKHLLLALKHQQLLLRWLLLPLLLLLLLLRALKLHLRLSLSRQHARSSSGDVCPDDTRCARTSITRPPSSDDCRGAFGPGSCVGFT